MKVCGWIRVVAPFLLPAAALLLSVWVVLSDPPKNHPSRKSLLMLRPSTTTTTDTAEEKSTSMVKSPPPPPPPPLKVFLLAGQSNMQGHGYVDMREDDDNNNNATSFRNGTLEWMVQTDPAKYGMLKKNSSHHCCTNNTAKWTQRDDVWIAYNRQRIGNVHVEVNQYGKLMAGYGGDPGEEHHQMGPELSFGWTVGDALNKDGDDYKILLIKIAWGGRSLAVDYRPPSSGGDTGLYYLSMMATTYMTLNQLPKLFPEYSGNYELAGFVWHQGWNDGCDTNMTAEYEFNLANLIRDVRTDLGVPNLPVSIGVSGMSGYTPQESRRNEIIAAQFAVANATKYPEFAGTVAAVETRSFARQPYPDGSPGTQGYHWNNNCESYWLVGEAMGEAMVKLIQGSNSTTTHDPQLQQDQKSLSSHLFAATTE